MQWQIQNSISDFQVIKWKQGRFTVPVFNELHEESVKFLSRELNIDWNGKTVVVSHHVPTFNHYPAQFKGDVLNEAFACELFPLIEMCRPDYWIYGHHHSPVPPFRLGVTEMLTNQLGYVKYNEHLYFAAGSHFII